MNGGSVSAVFISPGSTPLHLTSLCNRSGLWATNFLGILLVRHFWGVRWRRLFLKVTRIASARPLGGTARLGAPQTKSTAWGFMDKLKDTNLACQCIQGLAYGSILRERLASPPHSVKPPKQLSLMSPQDGAGLLLSHPDPEGTIWGPTCMWGRCPIRFLTLSRLCVLSFVHAPLLGTQRGDTLATWCMCCYCCLGRTGYRTHTMLFPSTIHWPKQVIWLSLKIHLIHFISIVGIVE